MYVWTRDGLGQAKWKEAFERGKTQLTEAVKCNQRATQINVAKAVRGNRFEGKDKGWAVHTGRIERLLGYTTKKPNEELFARSVAYWQCTRGLEPVDGIIGKNTWQRMQALIKLECPGYMPDEKARSRAIGYLHPAVIPLKGGRLLIADFGVNQSEIKAATKEEKLLKDWLHTFETDPTFRLHILGYSDCVGEEKNNERLRSNRAQQVYELLEKSAQSRVISKGPAPLGTYVADNVTTIGRAMNRGVIIVQAPRPATAARTEDVKVVVKSFIAYIGDKVGDLPVRCESPALLLSTGPVKLRLKDLAQITDSLFNENPISDARNRKYRMYSERTFKVTCRDGKLVSVVPGPLDTSVGLECAAYQQLCLTPPWLEVSDVSAERSGSSTYDFSWTAEGRPALAAEPGFQLVCPRTSRFIWHSIRGRIHCSGPRIRVLVWIRGSRFPSHRVFVNGRSKATLWQGGFAELWSAHPANRRRVMGMTFKDLPIRHPM
jgi:hypothetical protein